MQDDEHVIYPYDPDGSVPTPGGYVWYATRWIYFEEGGQYELKVAVDDFMTVWIGKDRNDLSLALTINGDLTAHTYSFHVTKGLKRFDLRIVNTPTIPGANPTWFAMSIWKGNYPVYVSRKDGWVGTVGDFPSDASVPGRPDSREYFPLFSVEPNWKNGLYERLSWYTDVLSSDTNAEQRRALRVLPRRSFTVDFLRQQANRSIVDSFLAGVGRGECLLPMFHEPVRLPEGTDPSSTGIAFSGAGPRAREITEGSLVMITNGDPSEYDLLRVGTVEAQRFSWGTYPTRHWPPGSVLYPIRVARVNGATTMENVSSAVARMQIVFDYDNPDLGLSDPPTPSPDQELLFQFPCNWRDRLRYDFDRKTFTHDNQSGKPWTTDPGGDTFVLSQFTVTMFGRAEVQRFRRFLGLVRGRSRSFFFLNPTDDIIPKGDIDGISRELMIEDMAFGDFYRQRPQPVRRRIGMLVDDRSPEYRTIEGVGPNGGLMLDSPFPKTDRDNIVRIAFLTPARLDQDTVELRHYTGLSNAVETRLTIRQQGQRRVELGA